MTHESLPCGFSSQSPDGDFFDPEVQAKLLEEGHVAVTVP